MTEAWEPMLRLTEDERRRVQDRIERAVRDWALLWAGSRQDRLGVSLELFGLGKPAPALGIDAVLVRTESTTGGLVIGIRESLVAGWVKPSAASSLAYELPRRGPLFKRVMVGLCRSLAAILLRTDESQVDPSLQNSDESVTERAEHWQLRIWAQNGEPALCVLMRPSLLESWLDRSASGRNNVDLAARHLTMADQSVAIRAVLGEIEVPFAELSHLAAGDVMLLPGGADEKVLIQSARGEDIAVGRLGSFEGSRRAVGIESLAKSG